MSKFLKVYDRSRVTTDWDCPRKRFWQYEYQGKGIVSTHTSLELFLGTTVHDALAAIAVSQSRDGGVDIDTIATAARQQMLDNLLPSVSVDPEGFNFAWEQATLAEGLVRGFYKQVWPSLMTQYPQIVSIEEEMVYNHDGLTFMSKPDLVVGDESGEFYYVEYKTTSSKKEGWVNSWDTAIQLHSTIKAIETTKGVKVNNVIVQGLYKGYESYGKQNSPFCYAYKRNGNPPFSQDEVRYDYKAGFKKYPVWEMAGGCKKWVDEMSQDILVDQFPQTAPIFVNEDMVDSFFRQRAFREKEIKQAMKDLYSDDESLIDLTHEIVDAAFPQRFDKCIPSFGRPCAYRMLCHGVVHNPLEQGFVYREPHHSPELDQWREKENEEVLV